MNRRDALKTLVISVTTPAWPDATETITADGYVRLGLSPVADGVADIWMDGRRLTQCEWDTPPLLQERVT